LKDLFTSKKRHGTGHNFSQVLNIFSPTFSLNVKEKETKMAWMFDGKDEVSSSILDDGSK
jgi:hypothetical protein